MSGALIPTTTTRRSRRKGPAQVGKVVPLHPAPEAAADIVADVAARSLRQRAAVSAMLQEAVRKSHERHRARAEECVPIGFAMDRPLLDDWLEIGRRMVAAQEARR